MVSRWEREGGIERGEGRPRRNGERCRERGGGREEGRRRQGKGWRESEREREREREKRVSESSIKSTITCTEAIEHSICVWLTTIPRPWYTSLSPT